MSRPSRAESETMIAVEHHPAYRVLIATPPPDYPGMSIPLSLLCSNPGEYLGPLLCQPGLSSELAYQQILDLVPAHPGVPLGLTFDGGIAVTHTDYRLAVARWERTQD